MDAMTLYMRDIAQYQLLTAGQEIELSHAIASGDEQARKDMINANLRLVVKISRRYAHKGLPLSDLIAEGNIGLMRAVEKFDSTHGCRFSTYATWWVRQAVERAIMNQARVIRLPVHVSKELQTMLRAANALRIELGREPDACEIATYMGKSSQRIHNLYEAYQSTESADQHLYEQGDFTLYDVTEDVQATAPDEHLDASIRAQLIDMWLSLLTEKERDVVALRYGLDKQDVRTLEVIGTRMGVTRERVRQIQVGALQKLRHVISKNMSLEEVL